MFPLSATDISGNWATVMLPVNADDFIDWARVETQVDALIEAGVNGIYTNGTTGEFWSQTEGEYDRLSRLVAERCDRAGMPFQIGACHVSPQLTIERVRRARDLNPGAIQITLPDWWQPNETESIAALKRFAEAAAPVGLVLYNPPHAKRKLTPADFGRLKNAVPEIVGVKVAGGDAQWYEAMRTEMTGLSVFVPGHQLATGLKLGAQGSYSNVACLHPRGAQVWFESMRIAPDAALDLERRIQDFMNRHIVPFRDVHGFSNFALDKLLAAIGGWTNAGTRVRWPYSSIPMSEANRLRPIALEMLPEILEPSACRAV
ncbi:MAG TPA: dihydrodipicolinate synthase family protein [Verrucomicrobiae bacterium]|jgi:dihydrodipicolinate synthase/N-acetylneuraminate lyase|nr:dihydrodipicolinate synthase family protein [Verrucomicrobiae bacterium]